MIGWIEGIQNAIEYIEDNLTEELKIEEIAERACVSAFHCIMNTTCYAGGSKKLIAMSR